MTLILMATTTIPVKIGASLVGASNTSMKSSALAVLLGIVATALCFTLLSGLTSLLAAYAAISIAYWLVLKPSFIGSFGLTFLVFLIQLAVIQGLVNLGRFASA
jgi:hypothetical protein